MRRATTNSRSFAGRYQYWKRACTTTWKMASWCLLKPTTGRVAAAVEMAAGIARLSM